MVFAILNKKVLFIITNKEIQFAIQFLLQLHLACMVFSL